MLINDRCYDIDKFFLVPDEFGIYEHIVGGDILCEFYGICRFIMRVDISSFRFECRFAYMLLAEESFICIMVYHLEKK